MPAPPQSVWPIVSDTHAFNRAIGLGPWTFTETPDPQGGSIREGSFKSLGRQITWDERPFEWVDGQAFSVLRIFHNGPFLTVVTGLELEPTDNSTTLIHTIEAEPRSFLWGIVTRYYFGFHTRRQLDRVFGNFAKHLKGETESALPQSAPQLPRGRIDRVKNLQSSLADAGFGYPLAQRLVNHVSEAPDDHCQRIRPYSLADSWNEDRETVLRICLHATRLGLLELRWDVMCPLCLGAKGTVSSLAELRQQAHCSSCNIQFDSNFDRFVEVSFRPSEWIRQLEMGSYCVGGPGNTQHILVQQTLEPKSKTTLTVDLADGLYRLRGPQIEGSALIEVKPGNGSQELVQFSLPRTGISPEMIQVAPCTLRLALENAGDKSVQVIFERTEWPEDSTTAAQVTALQDCRDLFSSEVLAPGEHFQVRYLTFMFTDLVASTAMYRERGDAPAYALVRDHFEVLKEQITKHHGAVVKTIGDAVMAVFQEPGDAIASGLDIHDPLQEGAGLLLKIGVHAGPCMVVNLDGRLDYFGTTVNTAVRLESHSGGGDVVVRADMLEDSIVANVLADQEIATERLKVGLKGFEDEVPICRITRRRDAKGK